MAGDPYPSRRDRAVMRGNRYQGGDALFLNFTDWVSGSGRIGAWISEAWITPSGWVTSALETPSPDSDSKFDRYRRRQP
jgi:hypothetical protein